MINKLKIGDKVRFKDPVNPRFGQEGVITSISPCGQYYRINGEASGNDDWVFELLPTKTDAELADEYRLHLSEIRSIHAKMVERGFKLSGNGQTFAINLVPVEEIKFVKEVTTKIEL